MSTPPSPARPTRLAGFILLGVAVIAVGLGVFALTNSGGGNSQASGGSSTRPAPTTTVRPTTTRSTARPTTTTPPPTTTTYPSGQTTTVAPPPTTTAAAPGGPGSGGSGAGGAGGGQGASGGGASAPVPVRVYNNGTIPKLAASAAQDFRNAGYDVVETGNYSESQGVISTSTAYYSPLPGEQATAEALGRQFSMRVQPRFPGIASASPGVIVIVTNDFKGPH